jgi:hypothetical protein
VHLVNLQFEWMGVMRITQGLSPIGEWGGGRGPRQIAAAGTPGEGRGRSRRRAAQPAAADDGGLAAIQAFIEAEREERDRVLAEMRRQEDQQREADAQMAITGTRVGARAQRTERSTGGTAAPRAFERPVQPHAGADSRLVVRFVCESEVLKREYIDEQVFERLRRERFPGDVRPLFTEVNWIDDPITIYRDVENLELVNLAGQEEAGVRPFAGFEGYAVVNVGPATEDAPKGEAAQEDDASVATASGRKR